VLTDDERTAAERIFRAHGYDEPLRIATPISDDERVFVIPTAALTALPERALVTALQAALKRKVWLAPEGPGWAATTQLR
jgi:hypothetical protein